MAFKDLFTWGQVVFSIGKHFMAMDLPLCPAYPRLLHVAHRVESVVAAADPRSPPKISLRFIEIQKGKI